MPRKGHRADEIIAELRQADVLFGQGAKVAEVVKALMLSEVSSATSCSTGRSSTRCARRRFWSVRGEASDGRWHHDTVRPHSALGYRPPAPEAAARPWPAWVPPRPWPNRRCRISPTLRPDRLAEAGQPRSSVTPSWCRPAPRPGAPAPHPARAAVGCRSDGSRRCRSGSAPGLGPKPRPHARAEDPAWRAQLRRQGP
jgi:hypothetical protein